MKRTLALGVITLITTITALAQPPSWHERIEQSFAQHGIINASEPELIEVEFTHTPEGQVEAVYLTGSFAGWGSTANAMNDEDGDGTWTTTVGLAAGQHMYKFVEDGTNWVWDANNPNRVDDGHEGFNSVLMIAGVEVTDTEPGAIDGSVNVEFIVHSPDDRQFFQRTGEKSIQINLWTQRGDVEAVDLVCGQETAQVIGMDWTHAGESFDHWRVDIDGVDLSQTYQHLFIIRDGDHAVGLGANGVTDGVGENYALPYIVNVISHPNRSVPEWAMDAFWYQIFPERFRNGDPSNDHPEALPWTWAWHEKAGPNEDQFYVGVFERNFGGDLQGVAWSLDYLQDLGVNALYLNPVFESISLHKYDTWDYRHVDDNFGVLGDLASITDVADPETWTTTPSDQVFLDLIQDVHTRDMKVIVDGVFNHSGHGHWAFLDVIEQGLESAYADWYKVTSWDPFEYAGWAGEQDLPEFQQDENGLVAPVADHIMNITSRWQDPNGDGDPSDGIDGWRLDVPNLVAKPFWERWNAVVREENDDAYTVGELWGRDPSWTTPELFDAHMNYEWLRGVYSFFVNTEDAITPTELNAYMFNLHADYDYRTNFAMQNLLDSHDTDRIGSALVNPNRAVDKNNRVQDDGPDYDQSKPGPEAIARLRLIFLYQFTSVGAPMIWYGDEVGMWGADDPECRKPMLWDDLMPYDNPEAVIDHDLRDWVSLLAALRTEHEALRRGHLRPALLDDEQSVYAYTRRLHGNPSDADVVVAIHRGGGEVTVEVPVDWADGTGVQNALASEEPLIVEEGKVILTLGPDEGAVLVTLD